MEIKTKADILRIAAAGKPAAVVRRFVRGYLLNLALRDQYRETLDGVAPTEEDYQDWLYAQRTSEGWQPPEIGDEAVAAWMLDSYAQLREGAYPPVGDQLDALLKGFNQLRLQGTGLPDDLDVTLNQWLAVKESYPKP